MYVEGYMEIYGHDDIVRCRRLRTMLTSLYSECLKKPIDELILTHSMKND